jgi:hypothetical protein
VRRVLTHPGKRQHGEFAGFWLALWQGFIAPFVFVASLFKGDINVYEVHNNGSWYNFGYLFGLACFFRGGGNQTSRRCGKSNIGAGAKNRRLNPSTRKYQETSLSPSSSELSANLTLQD